MGKPLGRGIALSPGRRVICDLMDASMDMPLVAIQRTANVSEIVAARREASPRPSWCSIFTKAYGKAVSLHPELRRAYLAFPWGRLFEYERNIADIAVEARVGEETAVAFARIKQPETLPLLEIDRILDACKANPLEKMHHYRRALFLARFPRFIRRWAWWSALNLSASQRARYVGTFGVTSVGHLGVDSLKPLSAETSLLHYGAIDPLGNITFRVTFDHRVMDGTAPSLALCDMERILKSDILAELQSLRPCAAPPILNAA